MCLLNIEVFNVVRTLFFLTLSYSVITLRHSFNLEKLFPLAFGCLLENKHRNAARFMKQAAGLISLQVCLSLSLMCQLVVKCSILLFLYPIFLLNSPRTQDSCVLCPGVFTSPPFE
jgi:hypothetical protein